MDSVAQLRPGETAGPFEIVIPRAILFLETFYRKTTKWERFLLRAKLMHGTRRRELWERFTPWFDEHGWYVS